MAKEVPVGFDLTQFKNLIDTNGLNFRWSRAVTCPCVTPQSESFDPTCLRCQGTGIWYVHPDLSVRRHQGDRDWAHVRAGFASGTVSWDRAREIGQWGDGDAQLTVLGEARVGLGDRFVGLDQRLPWHELLTRGTEPEVAVGRTGRPTAAQFQTMRYRPLTMHFVAGRDGTEYFEHHDYDMVREREGEPARLVWRDDRGPAEGEPYVVHYDCNPVWVVSKVAYAVQHLLGPTRGIRGPAGVQTLPLTFSVALDFLPRKEGT